MIWFFSVQPITAKKGKNSHCAESNGKDSSSQPDASRLGIGLDRNPSCYGKHEEIESNCV